MGTSEEKIVTPNFSFLAEALGAGNPEQFLFAFSMLYIVVVVLTIIVFNLGFARKLPILKTVVVYIALLFGSLFIALLALRLPVVESLLIATFVLGAYKYRLHKERQQTSV
ncbi:YlaH-like family protein [Anaerobacillus isosaccharinicus]|uniref:YlaH-like family protein n=1 Tax=Anaerobacillus isosaccharinicus TaxID=1532552 RepID=A0A1S2M7T8_9BACI|nr:YlaH-like family protein [Anaerobacillus isosaccharinicus]MBA5587493.1 YlaH-like family protein [Anaerobacillus isosaccharinicus]QOY34325.1 YlaH-like family protein [Anaerobacillus isosaccharinicus]